MTVYDPYLDNNYAPPPYPSADNTINSISSSSSSSLPPPGLRQYIKTLPIGTQAKYPPPPPTPSLVQTATHNRQFVTDGVAGQTLI